MIIIKVRMVHKLFAINFVAVAKWTEVVVHKLNSDIFPKVVNTVVTTVSHIRILEDFVRNSVVGMKVIDTAVIILIIDITLAIIVRVRFSEIKFLDTVTSFAADQKLIDPAAAMKLSDICRMASFVMIILWAKVEFKHSVIIIVAVQIHIDIVVQILVITMCLQPATIVVILCSEEMDQVDFVKIIAVEIPRTDTAVH